MKILTRSTIEDILSLTPMQEGMLFHYLRNPGSDLYFEQLSLAISGEIDDELFKKSWNFVIRTNEMLRAVFRWENVENPIQVILKKDNLSYEYYDVSGENAEKAKKRLEEIKSKDIEKKFDLREVPFRIILCKVGENKYEMILSNHHILYDGWSNGILLKEFFSTYNDLSRGKELIKPGKAKFKDFIKWIQNQDKNEQEKFWKDYLKGFDAQTGLPLKRKREKEAPVGRTGNLQMRFEEETKRKIEDFVKGQGITLASFLFSAWGLLLQKYNNCHDVIFGTTVSGRSARLTGIEKTVGLFVNTLPLRVQTHSHEKIRDLLHRINKVLLMREPYEPTSLVDIKKYSEIDNKEELFDSVFVLENYPLESRLAQGDNQFSLSIDSYAVVEATHYDLTTVVEVLAGIEFNFNYNKETFDEDSAARLTNHFRCVLQQMVGEPERDVSKIEIISGEEKAQLLKEFNDTDADYPKDKTIVQLFARQVERTPDYAALHECMDTWMPGGGHMTYRELNVKSDQLAYLLKENGVGLETIVGIMMERSLEMMIAIFGILKAGCVYMPIDPGYPPERINYMLADSKAAILLKKSEIRNPKFETNPNDPNTNDQNKRARVTILDFEHLNFEFVSNFEFRASNFVSSNLAYVIYTSGSTGRPKGVMIRHCSLVNRLNWMQKSYPIGGGDVILQKTPIVFDVSLWELFWWGFQGASLCLLGPGQEKNPAAIVEAVNRDNVTTIHFVPSMLNAFMEYLEHSLSFDLNGLRSLKQVFASGEALLTHQVKRFNHLLNKTNGTRLINLYGPTEAAVDVSYYNCPADENHETIPIGKPIDNIKLYIVDNDFNLQPLEVAGELCIGGVGIARGYLNTPELTAEKFKRDVISHSSLVSGSPSKLSTNDQCPMTNDRSSQSPNPPFPQSPIYKTGDLARWFRGGNIEFLGRVDLQVKIRGFRIELGEIENRLLTHRDIKEAVVIVLEDRNNENYLCGYFTSDQELHASSLKTHLSQLLPDYMVPSFFVRVERIPLTRSGKVDRRALPEPGRQGLQVKPTGIPPKSQVERIIAGAWQQVLKIDNVGVNDNFFDIGGNSLYIIRLSSKLKGIFHRDVPVVALFNYPTVSAQARYLGGRDGENGVVEVTGISGDSDRPVNAVAFWGMEIAVIGMAGRFPGARHIHEFWDNLKNGTDCISFFTEEELDSLGISPELYQSPYYVKAKGVLENMAYFDADFFDYSAREARLMDPQLRILHECAWEALENAGYDPGTYNGRIGLYAGAFSNNWWVQQLSQHITTHAELLSIGSLNERDYLANRVSYKLNLKGPAVTIQTACSTSLVAVDAACQALLSGKCEMALAGGVTLTFQDRGGYLYEEGMVRSPDGHCRPFDARANGTMGGNGVGIVVLKPLEKAVRDMDHIKAVIKGSAVNNDGARKVGYTAPSVQGQVEVIRAALQAAAVAPETISYLETHGTGTELGDPVEIEALKQAFNTNKKGFCAIGAVKANIGHLDAAAGAAGLIKTILALEHRMVPPAVNFETPHPQIDFENSPFYVNTQLQEWKIENHPLRAGVSSFGIGGTNAHVVLEEFSEGTGGLAPLPVEPHSRGYQLIVLSAKTPSALDKMTENLAEYFKKNLLNRGNHENPTNPGPTLADAAYTLQVGRKHFPHRRMLVCSQINEAAAALSSPGSAPVKPRTSVVKKENRPVIFMFPGLGSQYVNMGLDLYKTERVFREEMDRCFDILNSLVEYEIKEILYPSSKFNRSNRSNKSYKSHINQTEIAQPVTFIFEYALARLLMHWEIKPHEMIGYSFGEYVTACLSGVFSLEDALKLVVYRGQAMQKLPVGAMLSVPLPVKELEPLLENEGELSIAIDNGSSCVVSGPGAVVDVFEKRMKQMRYICMRLPVSRAVHSFMMEPLKEGFNAEAGSIPRNKPQIPYISNVTGKRIKDSEAVDPRYWGTHMRETVRFADGLRELMKEPDALFIEVGPGHELSSLLVRHLCPGGGNKNRQQPVLNLVRHPDLEVSDVYFLLNQIGKLWLNGVEIDWPGFYAHQKRYRMALPSYPFAGQHYWIQEAPNQSKLEKTSTGASLSKKPDIRDWFYLPGWERTQLLSGDRLEKPSREDWLVFSHGTCFDTRLAERLSREGNPLITVTGGPGFKKIGESRYEINPGQSHDYGRLLEELQRINGNPAVIVYLWSMYTGEQGPLEKESVDRAREQGWTGLLYLVQALSEQENPGAVSIQVVTRNLHEVTGEEQLFPQQALVLGLVKVIPQEYPNIRCRSIDIVLPEPGSDQEAKLMNQLYREFSSRSPDPVAAYRGSYRWLQTFSPVSLPGNEKIPTRLRPGGVYLLTGGLGNIGFTLARYLAETLKAKLILTGRTALPARNEWDAYLAAHDENDGRARRIRRVLQLEEKGAKVLVFSTDAADYRQMQAVVNQSRECFGQIHGVIHAAGVVDGETFQSIAEITGKALETQFQSKVYSLLVLEKLFRDRPLDFCLLISSPSSILGGLGFAAYASVNAFIDAFVYWRNRESVTGSPWLAVNWGDWKFPYQPHQGVRVQMQSTLEQLLITPEQGIKTFQYLLTEYPSHQVVVSAGDLQQRINQWVRLEFKQDAKTNRTPPDKSSVSHQRPDLMSPYVAPGSHIEKILSGIWQTYFGLEQVGIEDNFFELGATSLDMIQLNRKVKEATGKELAVTTLFRYPNIRSLALHLNREGKVSINKSRTAKIHQARKNLQKKAGILKV
jgi:amino acid adenylation domain-containing protein